MSTAPHKSPLESSPPEAWEPLLRFARFALRPVDKFLSIEAASGVLLLLAAAAALVWANSPWAASYNWLRHLPIGVQIGGFTFERSLEWCINDGLMVIFFFVVGLEIRRELFCGELSEWRRAALPVAAALGGMLVPASLYLVLAGGPETRVGWGVPMATDIAFAVGILTLLGKRIPPALRVLLLALAVIDDLGAILVIAVFYSDGIGLLGLVIAAASLGAIRVMQRFGVRSRLAYCVPSLVAWAGIYAAGIHPTIAGVLVGLMTPVRAWAGPKGFVSGVRKELDHLEENSGQLSNHEVAEHLRHVSLAGREALSPAEGLIESLHPWVAFGIMPIFALANAGVSLEGGVTGASSVQVITAIIIALIAGKLCGVLGLSWLTVRLRIAKLPMGVNLRHMIVLGTVAAVGFTMAIFIAQLAFKDERLLAAAKIGVLAASGIAGVGALILGRLLLAPNVVEGAAKTGDDAERSTEL